MSRFVPWAVIAAAVGAGAAATGFRDEVNPSIQGAGLEAGEQAAGASLLGQFRSSAASSLYQRTDLYLHGGVELRPMTEGEKQAGKVGSDLHEGEAAVLGDESHLVTSIPSAADDFRGVFGDLERATAPYQDMHDHKHNSPETAFPLFRLMTWVDPQFLPGWTTGSMLIGSNNSKQATDEAIAFLNEGLKQNPDSPEIMTRIGALVASKKQDFTKGMDWFEKAYAATMKIERPSPDQLETREDVFRWVAITANRIGDTQREREIVEEGLKLFPEDQVMLRFGIQLGLLDEPNLPKSSPNQNP